MSQISGSNFDPGNTRQFSESQNAGFAGGGGDPGGNPGLSESEISELESSVSNVNFNDTSSSTADELFSLRVVYILSGDPYSPYDKFYTSIQLLDNGNKVFIGQFLYSSGDSVTPIKIPLIGQSIEELSDSLNLYPGVRAEILNGSHLKEASLLDATGFYDATDIWSFFSSQEDVSGTNSSGLTSTLAQDIKFYLTSVEPRISQNNPTQSLGGFISPTEVYITDILQSSVSFYDNTIITEGANLGDFSLIQIQDEIMSVDAWTDEIAAVSGRNVFGTPLRFHPQGSIVRGISKNDIFDSRFSRERTQYRCIAIRNESDTEYLKSVKVYFNLLTRNSYANTRLAIEIPRSEYRSSVANSGTDSYFTDMSLADIFEDNHYVTASVTFTSGSNSGQTRIVTSYNGTDGTFFLSERLPAEVQSDDAYYVDTAPSQRVPVGVESPSTVNSVGDPPTPPYLITNFSNALFFSGGVSIDVDETRSGQTTLGPRESIYVWIERRLEDNNRGFEGNRSFVTIGYSRV